MSNAQPTNYKQTQLCNNKTDISITVPGSDSIVHHDIIKDDNLRKQTQNNVISIILKKQNNKIHINSISK